MRGNKGEAQKVWPAGPPAMEQLEPRLLLSADSLNAELLTPLNAPLNEPAIYADLNQQEQGIQDDVPSAILTYVLSCDDPDTASADTGVSGPEESQEEGLLEQPLTAPLETVPADVEPTGQPAGAPLVQAERVLSVSLHESVLVRGYCQR